MKNKSAIILAVLLVALCLCATLVACNDPSGPGGGGPGGGGGGDSDCRHRWSYPTYDSNQHQKVCDKCHESTYEAHVMEGQHCKWCGYYQQPACEHPEFFYNTKDEEFHVAQCGRCEYHYDEEHDFNGGTECVKCHAQKTDLIRKIGNLYYVLYGDNTAAVTARQDGITMQTVTGNVTVPQTVEYKGTTYTVTKVADEGFAESKVTSVVLPQTIKEIGNNAFANCENLTSVNLPQGLQRIGNWAFGNSPKLSSVTIPASVTTVEEQAFWITSSGIFTIYCEAESQPAGFAQNWAKLEVNSPDFTRVVWNVNEVGSTDDYDYAVLNDGTATITNYKGTDADLHVPQQLDGHTVTAIADKAFYEIEEIKTVSLPDGLERVGSMAFIRVGMDPYTYVEISASVTTFGEMPFSDVGVMYFECSKENRPDFIIANETDFAFLTGLVFDSATQAVLIDGVRYALDEATRTAEVSLNANDISGDVVLPKQVTHNGVTYDVNGARAYAFHNCGPSINSIYIPATYVNFGEGFVSRGGNSHYPNCYFEGEVSQEVGTLMFGGTIDFLMASTFNAVYDEQSELWFSVKNDVATVGRQKFDRAGEVKIPTSITVNATQYPVTALRSEAFMYCSEVTKIEIPNTINEIPSKAIYACGKLTEITFAADSPLTTIESESISLCSALKSIKIPQSVTRIGRDNFVNCSSLEGVYITDLASWLGVTMENAEANPLRYAHNLYVNGSLLTELVVPSNVTEIYVYTLQGWNGTKVTVHKDVIAVGFGAFRNCTKLQTVNFASDATGLNLEGEAFYNCSSLTSVTFPAGLKKIGGDAFRNCSALQTLEFAPDTENLFIDGRAFFNCSALSAVTIPAGVKTMRSQVFDGCDSLIVYCVDVENNPLLSWNSDWWEYASGRTVWNCESNDTSSNGTTYATIDGLRYQIKDGVAAVMTQPRTLSGNVVIPNEITYKNTTYAVTAIVDKAFIDCEGVTSVNVGYNVTSLGQNAFYGCVSLANVTFNKRPANETEGIKEEYLLTTIGNNAFVGCDALTAISIPESVVTIGDYAFSGCGVLATVDLLNPQPTDENPDVTPGKLTTIGEKAFYNCPLLTEIYIPGSVTSIGYDAFYGATALTVYCEASQKGANWDGTWNRYYSTSNGSYYIDVVWDYRNNVLSEKDHYQYVVVDGVRYGLKDDEATAVRQLPNITSVTIPAQITYDGKTYPVKRIGLSAFRNCADLRSVTFAPNSNVIAIEREAFSNCTALTQITIPASVVRIYALAFNGCTNLTRVDISDLTKWCKINFENNTSNPLYYAHDLYLNGVKLTEIIVPQDVTTLSGAFCGWNGTKIVIGENVTIMHRFTFTACENLTIYCRFASRPTGYDESWYIGCKEVVWNYTGD